MPRKHFSIEDPNQRVGLNLQFTCGKRPKVSRVEPDSLAARRGVVVGDELVEMNRVQVKTEQEVKGILKTRPLVLVFECKTWLQEVVSERTRVEDVHGLAELFSWPVNQAKDRGAEFETRLIELRKARGYQIAFAKSEESQEITAAAGFFVLQGLCEDFPRLVLQEYVDQTNDDDDTGLFAFVCRYAQDIGCVRIVVTCETSSSKAIQFFLNRGMDINGLILQRGVL